MSGGGEDKPVLKSLGITVIKADYIKTKRPVFFGQKEFVYTLKMCR